MATTAGKGEKKMAVMRCRGIPRRYKRMTVKGIETATAVSMHKQ